MTLFLTTSKICGIRAKKKKTLRRKKMLTPFLAQNIFFVRIIFVSWKKIRDRFKQWQVSKIHFFLDI